MPVKRPARIAWSTASNPAPWRRPDKAQSGFGRHAFGMRRGGREEPDVVPRGSGRAPTPPEARRAPPCDPPAHAGACRGCRHSPAAAIAVTERACPASASSSATHPPASCLPGEACPATAARRTPPPHRQARPAPGHRGRRAPVALPKPGRSSATTSRSALNRSITGSHTRRSAPSACEQDERRARSTAVEGELHCRPQRGGAGHGSADQRRAAGDDHSCGRRALGEAAAARQGCPMSARSPAMLAARYGRTGAPRRAAAIANPCSATSRAPSPRSATCGRGLGGGRPEPAAGETCGNGDQRGAVGDAQRQHGKGGSA